MTNVSGTIEKKATRRGLFAFAVKALEDDGWKVSRVLRGGKASLRLITKGGKSHKVSIRTSQDTWIAFPRKSDGKGWVTLDDVDYVIAASVDDRHNPTQARVHMVPGDDARARFERAYDARKKAGHTLPVGRGIWLSLYDTDAKEPVGHVGAGMGIDYGTLAVLDLAKGGLPVATELADEENDVADDDQDAVAVEAPLTIAEAKRRLATALGVPESAIKITVEH